MSKAIPEQLDEVAVAMTGSRSARPGQEPKPLHALAALEAEGVTTVAELDSLAAAAEWLDWACFRTKCALEALPFMVNILAQHALKDTMLAFAEAHGRDSALTYALVILCGVAIPAVLCVLVESSTRGLTPRLTLGKLSGFKAKDRFQDIFCEPMAEFGLVLVLYQMIINMADIIDGANAHDSVGWWQVLAAALGTAWQTQKSWRNANFYLRRPVAGGRCVQFWLKGSEAEIVAAIGALRRPQQALRLRTLDALRDLVCALPGSLVGALAHSSCWGTAIALAPSAACAYRAQNVADPALQHDLNLLAACLVAGLPMLWVGRANRAFWEGVVRRWSGGRLSRKSAERIGNATNRFIWELAGSCAATARGVWLWMAAKL